MFANLGSKLVSAPNLSWWLGSMNDCKNSLGCEPVSKKCISHAYITELDLSVFKLKWFLTILK